MEKPNELPYPFPDPPKPIPCVDGATLDPPPPDPPLEGVVKCPKCGWWHKLEQATGEALGEAFDNRGQ
jgi:hypothetical protein